MEKVSMLPTVKSAASASPLRSLERLVRETLDDVTRLRHEVAELKSLAASLRERGHGANVDASDDLLRAGPVTTVVRAEPDFDWEAWARETKARIRGEHLGGEQLEAKAS